MATKATNEVPTQTEQPQMPTQKKSSTPAIPKEVVEAGLVPYLMQPKQAFVAAGGTEQKFSMEVNFAAQAMAKNPYLIECAKRDPYQLVEAIKTVGLTGLSLNPVLKLGYLVPFNGKIDFMSSYMGKMEILIRTGVVKSIYAELVFEKDHFVYRKGTNGTLEHTPDVFAKDRGELKGGYYYAVLTNGEIQYDVMPKSRIEEIKSRSQSVKSGKASPWSTDYYEMAKKTILNWAFKSLPKTGISEDLLKVLESEENFEVADFEAWRKEQEQNQKDSFKSDDKFTPFEEVRDDPDKQ